MLKEILKEVRRKKIITAIQFILILTLILIGDLSDFEFIIAILANSIICSIEFLLIDIEYKGRI